MPRDTLTVNDISRAGLTTPAETAGDSVDNHEFANDGRTLIIVRNADAGGPHTVTFILPGTVDGQAVADRAVAVAASTEKIFGPFPKADYNVAGKVQVNVDSAELKLTALRLPSS